jgi:uncharacterized SAM-binding protein YcdF (DUF218 family)
MKISASVIRQARELWDYMSSPNSIFRADAIVVCCSYDLRVCDHACRLLEAGYAETLVLSGDRGNWTRELWDRPEALIYRDRALKKGIDPKRIITEEKARNLGENIGLSRKLLPEARRIILVSKPNTLLRLRLTCERGWPGVESRCSAPPLRFPEDASPVIGLPGLIHEMVGDIQRIQEYPAKGFQSPHDLPPEILRAYRTLRDYGFDHHTF